LGGLNVGRALRPAVVSCAGHLMLVIGPNRHGLDLPSWVTEDDGVVEVALAHTQLGRES